ncbi:MAG: hypothetical protein KIS66_06930 [Fimbriimonadaceae bacterium]|nr:hypothetical protein [Fimbriimonadaceae bacterium]
MPVTNYHTVNGRTIGETTDGVRTDYLTDALGSVTATVDQSQNVLNTYRYKPYGGLLAKTGSSPDPKFLWTGDTGSRTTGLAYFEQYNRARHYGSMQAGWTSVDPLWPTTSTYSYSLASPTSFIDASGLIGVPALGCANIMYKWVITCSHRKTNDRTVVIHRKYSYCDGDAQCDRCFPKADMVFTCDTHISMETVIKGYDDWEVREGFVDWDAKSSCPGSGFLSGVLKDILAKYLVADIVRLFRREVGGSGLGKRAYYTDCVGRGDYWETRFASKAGTLLCAEGCTNPGCVKSQLPISNPLLPHCRPATGGGGSW